MITLQTPEKDIPITVIYSNRKTFGIEIKNCKVTVRIPNRTSNRQLKAFVEKHRDWIIRKYDEASEQSRSKENVNLKIPDYEELRGSERIIIKQKFSEKTDYYANLMGVNYGKITIRNQKTRWGSCSSKGNLNFNYKLYYMPERLMDYVIVHELAHLKYMNHSKEFWRVVETYYPSYKQCREELRRS